MSVTGHLRRVVIRAGWRKSILKQTRQNRNRLKSDRHHGSNPAKTVLGDGTPELRLGGIVLVEVIVPPG